MDENKKNRPGDQRSKTEREEAGSAWKASPGLSTPSTGAPGRGPPLYDYRTEEEERIAAATTGTSPEPLTATISEQTEGEFTLEGASVGAAPAVPKEGAVSGVFREMGPEGSSEVNVEEKTGIGREGRDKLAAAKDTVREKASEASSKVAQTARTQVDQRKGQVADRLEGIQGQLHEKVSGKAEDLVNQFTTRADDYLSKATHLLREKNSDELLELARNEFRSRPLAVAGGFFALGFIGARLLRS